MVLGRTKDRANLGEIQLRTPSQFWSSRYLADASGLLTINPFLGLALILTLFSSAGIPPFAGFIIKLTVLFLIVGSNHLGLAFIGLACSVLSCYYYLSLIVISAHETTRGVSHKSFSDVTLGLTTPSFGIASLLGILLSLLTLYVSLGGY